METVLVSAVILLWLLLLVPAVLVALIPANPFAADTRSPRMTTPILFPPAPLDPNAQGGQAVA